jgi:hypothetical protein
MCVSDASARVLVAGHFDLLDFGLQRSKEFFEFGLTTLIWNPRNEYLQIVYLSSLSYDLFRFLFFGSLTLRLRLLRALFLRFSLGFRTSGL